MSLQSCSHPSTSAQKQKEKLLKGASLSHPRAVALPLTLSTRLSREMVSLSLPWKARSSEMVSYLCHWFGCSAIVSYCRSVWAVPRTGFQESWREFTVSWCGEECKAESWDVAVVLIWKYDGKAWGRNCRFDQLQCSINKTCCLD